MAIIESLSVTAGGGVISSASQSKQKGEIVSLFIGLGGTGTDAIRRIKTQVNERLIPDNAEAYDNPNSNVSVREYRHIKFLSIDTDQRVTKNKDQASPDVLDNTEKWDLSLQGFFGGVIDTTSRPDLKWINTKNPAITQVIAKGNGAGGIRQAGRYLLYDKIDSFEAKVIQLVDEAKVGITGDCKVVVHIFSGVSGGTGSGTFLDVCYAVKKALSGIANKMVVGYFFLPDINLSVKGLDAATRQYIPKNAYVALQELNYCMGLPNNGGSFRQIINDGTYLDWNCRPVDMCHIVGAQTENLAKITDDAYDYAMHTVTEYVMDFLSDFNNDEFDIYSLASNQDQRIAQASAPRTKGYIPCMVSLGASCASIPYREINTYLVSGVFEEYRKKHNENVTQADAEDAINKAWNVTALPVNTMVDKIYASILKKLSGNDSNGLQGYNYYQDPDGAGKPWDFLLDTVNSNGENDLEAFYLDALSSHIGNLAANSDKLTGQGVDGVVNRESLIYLLDQALDPIVKDINRGPQHAKNIIDFVEGANVLNLIAGLKAKNNAEYQSVEKDRTRKYEDYLETKRIFFNREKQGMFDNDKKRYQDFEDCVVAYVQLIEQVGGVYSTSPNAKPMVGVFEQVNNVLTSLENQIRERIKTYYAPLADVLSDLTATFEANFKDLKNVASAAQRIGFNRPLVSVQDENIIALLDEHIREIPMGDTFRGFMTALIEAGYDVWQKREERLPKTIQSFFVGQGGLFRNSAGMTVDAFLEKKYGLTGDNLAQKIIDEYVRDLMNASSPLLPVDGSKLDNQKIYKRKVSFPNTSAVLSNALTSPKSGIDAGWTRIPSSISDRFLFVQIRDGFPMQAYAEIGKIESQYFTAAISDANHLYEENGIYDDMEYSDWRTLPSVSAPSTMSDQIPDALKTKRDSVKQLFDKAVEYGVIKITVPDDDTPNGNANDLEYSYIFDVPDSLQKEIEGISDELNKIMSAGTMAEKAAKLGAIQTKVNEMISSGSKKLAPTDMIIKQRPCRTDIDEYDSILKLDFLYYSPVYQIKIQEIINKIDANQNILKESLNLIKQKEEEFSKLEANSKNDFFRALYAGILKIKEDKSIVYEYDDNGMIRTYPLFEYGDRDKYIYEEIPFYQAYVSYLALEEYLQKAIYTQSSKARAFDETLKYAQEFKEKNLRDDDITRLRSKARNLFDSATADKIERFLVDLRNFIF